MKKCFNIFLLHFQDVFEQRGRSFVWLLTSLFNPLLLLLYWRGVFQQNQHISGWSLSTISSYYFLLTIAGALLMSHIEDQVSNEDIQQGILVSYLTKPFPYFWRKFFEEVPNRLLQGGFGIIICLGFIMFFRVALDLTRDPVMIVISLLVMFTAYMLSFIFKMVVGLSAFWLIDARGVYHVIEILLLLFAGYILPIDLMPQSFTTIAQILPFAYMIYYPVTVLQGKLSLEGALSIFLVQCLWLTGFYILYRILWFIGIRKFTGMGQ